MYRTILLFASSSMTTYSLHIWKYQILKKEARVIDENDSNLMERISCFVLLSFIILIIMIYFHRSYLSPKDSRLKKNHKSKNIIDIKLMILNDNLHTIIQIQIYIYIYIYVYIYELLSVNSYSISDLSSTYRWSKVHIRNYSKLLELWSNHFGKQQNPMWIFFF